jgi:hypothetical protein
MKIVKVFFFTLAISFLAASCKTQSCGCPTQQKKYYKQYGVVLTQAVTENQVL